MNCEEFRAAYLAGDESRDLNRHLEGCGSCRAAVEELADWGDTLSEPSLWEEPSPRLGAQVESLLNSAILAAPAQRRSRRWWWLGAAAALVLALVGTLSMARTNPPDWTLRLEGTEATDDASATVAGWNTDSGTRLLVNIYGLDDAPAGHVYELWLSEGPRHVSAGTFTGTNDVELWSGVARRDFPRLWITVEPLDQDPSPSARTMFDTVAYVEPPIR